MRGTIRQPRREISAPAGNVETFVALIDPKEFLKLAPTILKSPGKLLWTRYDAEAEIDSTDRQI
jgi:hypothetical protein